MTRHLARLADISYRYRGRMVLAWIVAAVLIIAVGSALAGEFNAEYNTPGSESKAAADLTEQRFGGYSGQEIYVVAKTRAASASRPRRPSGSQAFFVQAEKVEHIDPFTPRSASPRTARSPRPPFRSPFPAGM